MQNLTTRILCLTLWVATFAVQHVEAQEIRDTTAPTSVDPKLIEWMNAKIVKEYTIGGIDITGIQYSDTSIVYSIANLQPGDKFIHPGSELFGKAINNLWRQKLFSNIRIYATRIEGDKVWFEIYVQERPRLGSYKFVGIRKTEEEDILTKVVLTKQTIISENTRREVSEKIIKHFREKGYRNVSVRIEEAPDPTFINSNALTIIVDKGNKVRINEVRIFGNERVDAFKLKRKLKGTKEMSKFTLRPDESGSPYGKTEPVSFKTYVKDWGFLSPSRTKQLLDPYFRFKLFSGAKFDDKKYEEDKERLLNYYNEMGFRDAQILADTQYLSAK
jgi:outer membrane protein insertion porin family